jgi:hypothetical protein
MPTQEHEVFFFWSFIVLIAIAGYTAYYAKKKGRNPYIWFAAVMLIGILAPLILLALPNVPPESETRSSDPTMSVSNPDPSLSENAVPPTSPPEFKPPMEEDHLWFYLNNAHQQIGPVSIFALRDLWNTGRLETSTYVWCEGMEQWARIEDLPKLKSALNRH